MRYRLLTLTGPALVVGTMLALAAGPAWGMPQTFTVTKQADTADGACAPADCSLREAVIAANGTPDLDTIRVPAGTYQLTGVPDEDGSVTGDLDVIQPATIVGAGARATLVRASATGDRAFQLDGDAGPSTIRDLAVTAGDPPPDSVGGCGGGIATGGELSLQRVSLVGNRSDSNCDGGGVWSAARAGSSSPGPRG